MEKQAKQVKVDDLELDEEERGILEAFERDGLVPVPDMEEELEKARQMARNTLAALKKDRRVNIRISSRDLEAIQQCALEEGIPYQTLMASILHKYAAGRLVDKGR